MSEETNPGKGATVIETTVVADEALLVKEFGLTPELAASFEEYAPGLAAVTIALLEAGPGGIVSGETGEGRVHGGVI
jgi:hypothetical protein